MLLKNVKITDYRTRAMERRKGGSGDSAKILHSHSFMVDGIEYTFLAKGHTQWIFKTDTVTFEYYTNEVKGRVYNNLVKSSLVTKDKNGETVIRGDRSYKRILRQPS